MTYIEPLTKDHICTLYLREQRLLQLFYYQWRTMNVKLNLRKCYELCTVTTHQILVIVYMFSSVSVREEQILTIGVEGQINLNFTC